MRFRIPQSIAEARQALDTALDGLPNTTEWLRSVIRWAGTDVEATIRAIDELRAAQPDRSGRELVETLFHHRRNVYAGQGALTALPGVLPGVGTAAQWAMELPATAVDLVLLLRHVTHLSHAAAHLAGRDLHTAPDAAVDTVIKLLNLWSGSEVAIPAADAAVELGEHARQRWQAKQRAHAAARSTIKRYLPRQALIQRWGRWEGKGLAERLALRQSVAAAAGLIPLGIGAAIGAGWNYYLLSTFKKTLLDHFFGDSVVLLQTPPDTRAIPGPDPARDPGATPPGTRRLPPPAPGGD